MQNVIEKICSARRGTIHNAKFRSVLRDKDGIRVYKVTEGLFRVGVDYSSIKSVIDAGKGGNALPGKNAHWEKFPFLIADDNGLKVRFTSAFNSRTKSKVRYYVDENGKVKETTKEDLMGMNLVAPSKLNRIRSEPLVTFCVFAENVLEFK